MSGFVQEARSMKMYAQMSGEHPDQDLIWYTNLPGARILYQEIRGPEDEPELRPLRFISDMKLLGITLHVTPISGGGLTLVDLKQQMVLRSCSEHFLTDTPFAPGT